MRVARPFVIDAWVLLPDHLHCLWTLPDGDADFSTRWMMIKRAVSLACREDYRRADWVTASKLKHRESTIWQRRFWEHQIRDENDFARHVDYIHFNPVKHGHGQRAVDWPHSTFHRYVRDGVLRMTGLLRWKARCQGMINAARVGTKPCPPLYLSFRGG